MRCRHFNLVGLVTASTGDYEPRSVVGNIHMNPEEAVRAAAAIGDSGNTASIGLHAALGFAHVGTYRDVGFKFGRWLDVVLMQRAL